ncbi:unnamed protein product, partial [Ectocarpus sp. 8 AP-2014]
LQNYSKPAGRRRLSCLSSCEMHTFCCVRRSRPPPFGGVSTSSSRRRHRISHGSTSERGQARSPPTAAGSTLPRLVLVLAATAAVRTARRARCVWWSENPPLLGQARLQLWPLPPLPNRLQS